MPVDPCCFVWCDPMGNIGPQQGSPGKVWWVYMVRCRDGSLYTGITTDLRRRVRQHNGEVIGGARYTASRRPVTLMAASQVIGRPAASREECRLKRLSRKEKEAWCLSNPCEG